MRGSSALCSGTAAAGFCREASETWNGVPVVARQGRRLGNLQGGPSRRSASWRWGLREASSRLLHSALAISLRLYVRGQILGYKRSKVNQYEHTSLIRLESVTAKEDAAYYLVRPIGFIYCSH